MAHLLGIMRIILGLLLFLFPGLLSLADIVEPYSAGLTWPVFVAFVFTNLVGGPLLVAGFFSRCAAFLCLVMWIAWSIAYLFFKFKTPVGITLMTFLNFGVPSLLLLTLALYGPGSWAINRK